MNTNENTTVMKDKKVILSTLWAFALFNYLYCDIMSLMDAEQLKAILTGAVGAIQMNEKFLLGAAILMEIPISMFLLSRLLKYKANRLANIIGGTIMTLVQISSLFAGTAPTLYYIFCSIIEISCTSFIVWYAVKWKKTESISNN
jgi:hypothetical protein